MSVVFFLVQILDEVFMESVKICIWITFVENFFLYQGGGGDEVR